MARLPLIRASVVLLTFLLPLAGASNPYIDWAEPEPGSYVASDGTFEVEVECKNSSGWDSIYVHFRMGGEAVDVEKDIHGGSPSNTFRLWFPGEYALQASCTGEDGTWAEPNHATWNVEVPPTVSAMDVDCAPTQDPTPAASAESNLTAWATNYLLNHPEPWHRAGAWMCAFEAWQEPLRYAVEIDRALIDVKHGLQELRAFDYSVWDGVTDAFPQVEAMWRIFEAALPVIEACYVALGALDALVDLRAAATTFIATGTQAAYNDMLAVFASIEPAYLGIINALHEAAQAIAQVAAEILAVANGFYQIAAEAASSEWWQWAEPIVIEVAYQTESVARLVDEVGNNVAGLAQPFATDIQFMQAMANPPTTSALLDATDGASEPAPAPVWAVLTALLAASLAARRRCKP